MPGDQVDVRRGGVARLSRHLDVGHMTVHDLGQSAAQGIVRPGHAARRDGEERLVRGDGGPRRQKKPHCEKYTQNLLQIEHPPLLYEQEL